MDTKEETRDYPPGPPPHGSIHRLVPIGMLRGAPRPDGGTTFSHVIASVDVRRNVLLTSSTKGGGTNLLNVIAAGLRSCTDVVLWGVDWQMTGITATHVRDAMAITEAQGARLMPLFDWLQSGPAGQRVIDEVYRVVAERAKLIAGTVRVTPDMPALVVMADMSQEDASRGQIADLIQLARIGPQFGVYVVLQVPRVNAGVVGIDGLTAFGVQIALRPTDGMGLAYQFGADVDTADAVDTLATPGAGLLRPEHGPPVKFDSWLITPARLLEVAADTDGWQTYLDEASLVEVGDRYRTRHTPSAQRPRHELGSIAWPVGLGSFVSFVRAIDNAHLTDGLTTDDLTIVTDPDGRRRAVIYDPADRPTTTD